MTDDSTNFAEEIVESQKLSAGQKLKLSLEGWRQMHGFPPLLTVVVDLLTVVAGVGLVGLTSSTVALVLGALLILTGVGSIGYHILRGGA